MASIDKATLMQSLNEADELVMRRQGLCSNTIMLIKNKATEANEYELAVFPSC